MDWARIGVSVLLSPPETFTGGEYTYQTPEGDRALLPADHYLNAVVTGSSHLNPPDWRPVLHWVPPSRGDRVVLLMFLGGSWD